MKVNYFLYCLIWTISCNISKNNDEGARENISTSACDVCINPNNYRKSKLSEYVSYFSHQNSEKLEDDIDIIVYSLAAYFPSQQTCEENNETCDTMKLEEVLKLFQIDALPMNQEAFLTVRSEFQYKLKPSLLSNLFVIADSSVMSDYTAFKSELSALGVIEVTAIDDSLDYFASTLEEGFVYFELLFENPLDLEDVIPMIQYLKQIEHVQDVAFNDLFAFNNRYIQIFGIKLF